MASAGSTYLNLDRSQNAALNLAAVKRADADAEEILAAANFVAIYECSKDAGSWVSARLGHATDNTGTVCGR